MPATIILPRPATGLIQERRSCRSFDGRGVEPGMLAALEGFAAALEPPFASRLRFGLIDREKVRAENLFSTGSYGMIKGARFYLAALAARDARRPWEDIGFSLEAAVLYATALGLASCWIGGIFDRRNFGKALAMGGNEMLPAVIALGLPADRPSLRDRLVRWGAGGDRRRSPSELFFSENWKTPLGGGAGPTWESVLQAVRLAPSASNKQPWRIVFIPGAFHFFLDRDKAYGKMMPLADLQRIDMGIAMCHFQLAAAELRLHGEWRDSFPEIPGTPAQYEYVASFLLKECPPRRH